MSSPLVTIISPTYNQERFVAACAESALAQTYANWEQIFVDDGSTDGTREIVESFTDPRIRLMALPHGGLGALSRNYNAALAEGRGSLVAIMEGDDRWPADKLEVQVSSFEDQQTLLSWGRADLIDEQGTRIGELATVQERGARVTFSARTAFHRLSRANFLTPTVTVMVRRDALDAIGGFQQMGSSLLADLPTWLWVVASRDGQVEFINHRLGEYRVHPSQTSQQRRAQMTREHIAVVRAVTAELDAPALHRVGWTADARRRAENRSRLAEGELALESGRYRPARDAFLGVLLAGANAGDSVLALAGVASSVTRINFVRALFGMRARLHRRRRARADRGVS
jgi:glycosyltransferase involved in cell wall biosynthesis